MRSLLALLACLPCVSAAAAETSWNDPAPYCHAVGTIDAPDGRYSGAAMPDWVARGLARAMHAPAGAPQSAFRHGAWRCLDGAVIACAVGANIPCDRRADTNHAPSDGARRYCMANRTADVVPAYAVGRETIFEWRCAAGKPEIARQVLDVDQAGFPSASWYRVAP